MMDSSIGTLATDYVTWLTEVRQVRPTTLRTYTSTLTAFVDWCSEMGIEHPGKVDVTALVAFTNRERFVTRKSRPSASTRKRERSTLQQFWTWMMKTGVVSSDPFWLFPQVDTPRYDPKPVSDEVWLKLWTSNLGLDDRLWLGLGYFCGLRRFEMATLAPSDVDANAGEMRFERKGAHRVNLEYLELIRTLQAKLPAVCVGSDKWCELLALQVELRSDMQYLCGSSVGHPTHDVDWFNHRMRALLKAADLPEGAITPHQLRHSCATNLLRCRVPIEIVADQMNHSNIQTTRRYLKTSGQLALWRLEH